MRSIQPISAKEIEKLCCGVSFFKPLPRALASKMPVECAGVIPKLTEECNRLAEEMLGKASSPVAIAGAISLLLRKLPRVIE